MSEERSEFNLEAAANEIIGNDSQETATPEIETTGSDNQEIDSQENPVESKELTPEEILRQVGEEKEDPKAIDEILNQINALGVIHNGQPVKLESVNQLKELISKGQDYTKKTMAHAEEVKAWKETQAKTETEWKQKETQLQQYVGEVSEKISENQIVETVLMDMKNSDPDLFEEFRLRYTGELNRRQQAMPYVKEFESKFQNLRGEIDGLKQQKQQAELSSIKQNWESNLGETQGKYAPQLAKLGVKVDWDKVKKSWASDISNEMTVEQALFAAYGKEITKANESYQKLLSTKNKTNNAMLKRTGISSTQGGKEATMKDVGGNYERLLKEISQNM